MGNFLVDDYNDNKGMCEYWWNYGFILDEIYFELIKWCFNDIIFFFKLNCDNVLN